MRDNHQGRDMSVAYTARVVGGMRTSHSSGIPFGPTDQRKSEQDQ
jgi:hypothetical protein